MPPSPVSRPLVAAVSAGLGVFATLGVRWLMPNLSALDAFGTGSFSAPAELQVSLVSVALGAVLGLLTLLPGRRGTVLAAFLVAPLIWALLVNVATQLTLSSMNSGAALTAGLLMSPFFVVVAGFGLVALSLFGAALNLILAALARLVAARGRTVQFVLLGVWALDLAVFIASLREPAEPSAGIVLASVPGVRECETLPFTDPLRGLGLPVSWRKEIPGESTVEFIVAGPADWTADQAVAVAMDRLSGLSPCQAGQRRWTARAVAATDVPVTLHLRAHGVKPGERVNFQAMLDSQLRSAFNGHLHLDDDGFAATSVQREWVLIPPGVEHDFTCEAAGAEVHSSEGLIGLRPVGRVPRFGGLTISYVK